MSDTASGAAALDTPPSATDEAKRLGRVFEEVARTQLATMAASARAIVRAWAEAELAIGAARLSGELDAASLPEAEAFRASPHLDREEMSRERIARWCDPGFGRRPLSDEDNGRVLYRDGSWFLPVPGTERPSALLSEYAVFDRVTHAEPMAMLHAPRLIASLSVPGLLADDAPGWQPDTLSGPSDAAAVLAWLDAMGPFPSSNRPARERTVEYVHVMDANRPRHPGDTSDA